MTWRDCRCTRYILGFPFFGSTLTNLAGFVARHAEPYNAGKNSPISLSLGGAGWGEDADSLSLGGEGGGEGKLPLPRGDAGPRCSLT